jgi:hypothetical protein
MIPKLFNSETVLSLSGEKLLKVLASPKQKEKIRSVRFLPPSLDGDDLGHFKVVLKPGTKYRKGR